MLPELNNSLVGQTIADRYQVLTELGSGGYACVYVAKHLGLNNLVAVKILHGHLSTDDVNVQRFRREAEASSKLKHAAIATVFDFGQLTDGRPYMIMEYLQGQTLGHIIDAEAPLPASRVVPLMVECCEALFYAHRRGLLHRDIKPDNIYVIRDIDGSEHAKLLDFGLAKVIYGENDNLSSLTQSGHVLGTPWYMSPEQCLTMPLDARSDLYSLACSLYEALCGKRPFGGKNLFDSMHAHIHQKPPPLNPAEGPPAVPPALESVVLRCLEKSPNDRFSTAAEFKNALVSAISPTIIDIESIRPATPLPTAMSLRTPPIDYDPIKVRLQKPHRASSRNTRIAVAICLSTMLAALAFGVWRSASRPATIHSSSVVPAQQQKAATESAVSDTVSTPANDTSSDVQESTLSPEYSAPKDFGDAADSDAHASVPNNQRIQELEGKVESLLKENQQVPLPAVAPIIQSSAADRQSSATTIDRYVSKYDASSKNVLPDSMRSELQNIFPPSSIQSYVQPGSGGMPAQMRRWARPGEPGFTPPPGWRPGMPLPPPPGFPPPPDGWRPAGFGPADGNLVDQGQSLNR